MSAHVLPPAVWADLLTARLADQGQLLTAYREFLWRALDLYTQEKQAHTLTRADYHASLDRARELQKQLRQRQPSAEPEVVS